MGLGVEVYNAAAGLFCPKEADDNPLAMLDSTMLNYRGLLGSSLLESTGTKLERFYFQPSSPWPTWSFIQ